MNTRGTAATEAVGRGPAIPEDKGLSALARRYHAVGIMRMLGVSCIATKGHDALSSSLPSLIQSGAIWAHPKGGLIRTPAVVPE